MAAAGEMDVDVSVEVHRDTYAETPEKTYALAAGFEKAEKVENDLGFFSSGHRETPFPAVLGSSCQASI